MNTNEPRPNRLYICVREDFPDYMAPTLVAHATLRHHLLHIDLPNTYEQEYKGWVVNSFRKCVVRLNLKEFNKVRELKGIVESWENNTLNGEVSCITYIHPPTTPLPNVLKFAKLWKPNIMD